MSKNNDDILKRQHSAKSWKNEMVGVKLKGRNEVKEASGQMGGRSEQDLPLSQQQSLKLVFRSAAVRLEQRCSGEDEVLRSWIRVLVRRQEQKA